MESQAHATADWVNSCISSNLGLTIKTALVHPQLSIELKGDPRETWSRTFNVGTAVQQALGPLADKINPKNIIIICVMSKSELEEFLASGTAQLEIFDACDGLIEQRVHSLIALAKAAQEDPSALEKLVRMHDEIIIELGSDLEAQTVFCLSSFFQQKKNEQGKGKRTVKTAVASAGAVVGGVAAGLAIASAVAAPVTAGLSLIPAAIFAAIAVASAARSVVGLSLAIKNHLIGIQAVYKDLQAMLEKLQQGGVAKGGVGSEVGKGILSGLTSGLSDEFLESQRAAAGLAQLLKERIGELRAEIEALIQSIHANFDQSLLIQRKVEEAEQQTGKLDRRLRRALSQHAASFGGLIESVGPLMKSLTQWQMIAGECDAQIKLLETQVSATGGAIAGIASKVSSPIISVLVPLVTTDVLGASIAAVDIVLGVAASAADLADTEGELQTLYEQYKGQEK